MVGGCPLMGEAAPPGGIAGVLLAGGLSRRMGGGDKALRRIGGLPLLDRIVERVRPQVDALVLNANGDPARFAGTGLPVVADTVPDFAGPLAGILAGLDWAARSAPGVRWVASFACDAPFLPVDLVDRLAAGRREEGAELACAASMGRAHPVFGLWPVALRADLRRALAEEGVRKVDLFTARYRLATVEIPPIETVVGPVDPFFNANRPDDLSEAERLLGVIDG